MMIAVDLYGAKAQSRRRANPRSVLQEILENNPTTDDTTLEEMTLEALRDHEDTEDLFGCIFEYWFTNNLRSLRLYAVTPRQKKEVVAKTRANKKRTEKVVSVVKANIVAKINQAAESLFNSVLPTGKTLANSTGSELKKIGGVYSTLAKKLKAGQTVKDAFSAEQVWAIYNT